MKLWKFTIAATLLAPLAGCMTKSQLREANQALELENFHLEQRLNDCCWKLEDAQRELDAARAGAAIPVYSGGPLSPLSPSRSPKPAKRDPNRPAEAGDVDVPPKIELPDDEPNMPSAGNRKERAPRYSGPPLISPPNPNVPEGILPQPVSARPPEGELIGAPAQGPYPPEGQPQAVPYAEPVPAAPPAPGPNWQQPGASAAPPLTPTPQPEPMLARPQDAPPPVREPESVGAPMPSQMPNHTPSSAPGPMVGAGPEPVIAPGAAGASAPIAQALPPGAPESVTPLPGTIDTNLRAQPDARPLVEPEPITAPYPSAAARPTSAPVARPPIARGNTQAGNAALSMMAINPKQTVWRQAPSGNSPDDGLTVVVEPRAQSGEIVEVDGTIAIVVVDPTLERSQGVIARWDFTGDKLGEHWQGTKEGGGLHFQLDWPGGRPKASQLDLYVRLTLPDRRQFVAEYALTPNGAAPAPEGAPTPAPELDRAPSEPPPGPPVSSPVDGPVSRTGVWTNIDPQTGARTSSRVGFVTRAGGPVGSGSSTGPSKAAANSSGEWKRAVTPLPPAPPSFDDSTPASSASSSIRISTPSSAGAGSAWTPYR